MHLPPQTTMGELWVDTFNGGGWDPDSHEDEDERFQDNRGGPLLLGGLLTLFLGIAVAPAAAVGFGAGSAFAAIAAYFPRQ